MRTQSWSPSRGDTSQAEAGWGVSGVVACICCHQKRSVSAPQCPLHLLQEVPACQGFPQLLTQLGGGEDTAHCSPPTQICDGCWGQGLPRVKLPSMVVGHCPTSIPMARSWWPQGLATVTLPEEMASLCLRCECKEETLPQTGMGQQVSALARSHRPALHWVLAFSRAPSCSGELCQPWPR